VLASIHNLTFYQRLVARLREAIVAGRFDAAATEIRTRLAGARNGREPDSVADLPAP
jgi:queuine/archaeosine tRNA-ribosyltransferase